MRKIALRVLAASAALALAVAACGNGSDDESGEPTGATDAVVEEAEQDRSTVTTETTGDTDGTDEEPQDPDGQDEATGTGTPSPAEVVANELAAQEAGDWEAVAALWADDAVAVQPDGTEIAVRSEVSFPIDDFDGDGIVTIMDDHLATAALTPAMGKTISSACTEVSETVVDCTETTSNAFSEAAGVDPLVMKLQVTVEDGLIVRQEFVGVVGDPSAFETATMSGFADYGRWVAETAPDEYEVMFDGTDMTMTMEAVELHLQMLPTYIDTMVG